MYFEPGQQIVLRYRRNIPGEVIIPVTIVEDGPTHVAFYTAPGTPYKGQATVDGERLGRDTPFVEREQMEKGLADGVWSGHHTLQIIRPDEPRATWLLWRDEDWSLRGYYVNLQAPLQRTATGFDTADYLLDLEVTPDFKWSWKDEDEVELARKHRLVDPEILDRMEEEGARAIQDIESRAWPFNAGYEIWRPDPSWEIPQLPNGWDAGLDVRFVPSWDLPQLPDDRNPVLGPATIDEFQSDR